MSDEREMKVALVQEWLRDQGIQYGYDAADNVVTGLERAGVEIWSLRQPKHQFNVQVWYTEEQDDGFLHEGVTAVEHHSTGCLHLRGTEHPVTASSPGHPATTSMVADWYPAEDWYAAEWTSHDGFKVCIVNAGEL